MNSFDIASLIYLVLLGSALVLWFIVQNRQNLGQLVQQMLAWVLIFVGVVAVWGLWSDIKHTVRPGQAALSGAGRVELPRAFDGHYYLTLEVNGAPVRFVVDTGASDIVLNHADARAVGLDPARLDYSHRAMTANGTVRLAPVRLDTIALGPIVDRDIPAAVNAATMEISLLGMQYLQHWEKIEIGGGTLVLTR